MYAAGNPKTKKAAKAALVGKNADDVLFQPGLGDSAPVNGRVNIAGPHYPAAHTWYASVTVVDGVITKVA